LVSIRTEEQSIAHPSMIDGGPFEPISRTLGRLYRGLHETLDVGILQLDHPKLATLEGSDEYLAPLAASPPNKEGLR
jgi:hypothetical protein